MNLFDVLVDEVPVSAYSYIFQGQTQTLGQIFVTSSLLEDFVQVRMAHISSDFLADFDGDTGAAPAIMIPWWPASAAISPRRP